MSKNDEVIIANLKDGILAIQLIKDIKIKKGKDLTKPEAFMYMHHLNNKLNKLIREYNNKIDFIKKYADEVEYGRAMQRAKKRETLPKLNTRIEKLKSEIETLGSRYNVDLMKGIEQLEEDK